MPDQKPETTLHYDGQPAPPRDDAAIPDYLLHWDRYVLKRRLGSGGMGEVFEAWDPRLERFVALKFLGSVDTGTLERFEREARAQARVDHPAICKVDEVGETGDVDAAVERARIAIAEGRWRLENGARITGRCGDCRSVHRHR